MNDTHHEPLLLTWASVLAAAAVAKAVPGLFSFLQGADQALALAAALAAALASAVAAAAIAPDDLVKQQPPL